MPISSIQNIEWTEKNLTKDETFYKKIEFLSQKFCIPEYFSKYLVDNEIDSEEKFLNFINPSIYFLHPPFLFKNFHNAIQLIHKAKEKDEVIFIFGDSDVDGIVGIKILYSALQKFGIKKIYYSIPENDEPYGISIKKIDIAFSKGASLIITVDNGISSIKEIEYAKSKGINVIITDHHNPQIELPDADSIINPKIEKYSYCNCLSGSGVAWKLIEGIIFSQTRIYNSTIFFIDIDISSFKNKKDENSLFLNISLLIIKNLQIDKQISFSVKVDDNIDNLQNLIKFNKKNLTFSLGKIYSKEETQAFFDEISKELVETNGLVITDQLDLFNLFISLFDIKIDQDKFKTIHSLVNNDTNFLRLLETYKIFYINKIDYLYFKFYSTVRYNYKKCIEELETYLPYVALATIADIMPVINENRYIISKGLEIINNIKPDFITNIMSTLINVNYPLSTYEFVWKISPLLNSPGRFGKGEVLLNYFLSLSIENSLISLKEINDFNIKRTLVLDNIFQTLKIVNDEKEIIYIEKDSVEPGLTGLLSARIVSLTSKPVIFVTKTKNGIFGSMRSKNSFNSFQFLCQFSKYFENFGGHPFASGFTIKKECYEDFIKELNYAILNLKTNFQNNNLSYYTSEITFDDLVDPLFEKWYKIIQPFGEELKVPIFYSRNVSLSNPIAIGRNNISLKLKVSQDNISFDALFFKNKQFLNEIKLNSINSIVFEPHYIQGNKLTLLIEDMFMDN